MIGQSIPRIDAVEKATGAAKFVTDLTLPRMLYGKILRSPLPHARVLSINVTKAKRVASVKAVITSGDTPKKKAGFFVGDELVLAFDKVRYVGEEVAAVAAASEEAAEEAISLIKVEYEELPAVFEAELALQPDAPAIYEKGNLAYHFHYARGDIEEGFKQADHLFESRYETQSVHQMYMEPRACIASSDPSGKLTIWGGFSRVFYIRDRVAHLLGLDPGKVRVIQPYTGGSFGGKGSSSKAPIGALLALKTGRPVRMVNSWEEEFGAGRPRVPGIILQKIGVKKDGTLMARQLKVICDCGAYLGIVPLIAETMAIRAENLYHFPHSDGEVLIAYTNNTPTGPHRAFGDPPGHFALESELDAIAEALSMDPIELRINNSVGPGQVTHHGWKVTSCGLKDCLGRVGELARWKEKIAKRRPGLGLGVACGVHTSGNRKMQNYDGSAAFVKIDPNGAVSLIIGESDTGQGATTVLAQMVAEELGVSFSRVRVVSADTEIAPFGLGSVASRVTVIGGNAARAAAADARQQLFEIAAGMLEAYPGDLMAAKDKIYVKGAPGRFVPFEQACQRAVYRSGGGPILGRGTYDPPTVLPDDNRYGNFSIAYPFCAQGVEVEVDQATGQFKLLNVFVAEDVGRVINPLSQEGQVQGCISQSLGLAAMEEIHREKGKVINANFMDYKIPSAVDMPWVESAFVQTEDPHGPFGAKAGGEGAMSPLAPALANAIYKAVGVRVRSLPITAEKILKALKEKGGCQR